MEKKPLKLVQGGLLAEMKRVMLGRSHEDAERFVQTVERRASLKSVPPCAARGSDEGTDAPTTLP